MDCNCFFCSNKRFSLNQSVGLLGEDSIVYEDENIFIIPDIAPLVVGHFLIVSKKHINSFAGADDAIYKSLEIAKNYLAGTIFKNSAFIFFEHGAVIENTAGSSIDHAHIHGLPLEENIDVDDYIRKCGYITSSKVLCDREMLLNYYNSKQPYIYYEMCDRQGWAFPVEILPHQFFRMLIAHFYSKNFDWKTQYSRFESKSIFNMTLSFAKKCLSNNLEVKL